MNKEKLPFRLGTTSYIIPDEILPNVRFLADLVDDIELVLFEVDDGPNNLPDQRTIDELNQLARQNHLSYTIHLPLDLRLAGNNGEQHISLKKAQKVIQCTQELNPFAYVLHLDGRELLQQSDPESLVKWNQQAFLALQQVSSWTGNPQLLAVENLEHYPIDLWDEVIKRASVSRCIDIGHLWVDKNDPVAFLKSRLHETRVLHIHGIGERDHQSLENVAREELSRVLSSILKYPFQGVMTIEVFNEDDLRSSITAIHKALEKQDLED
jgi:sugar phosphate isomerase/epimerase